MTIKSFRREGYEEQRIADKSLAYLQHSIEAGRLSALYVPSLRMVIVLGFVAVLLYGGILVFRGELAVGAYSACIFLTQRLLWPMASLASMVELYQRTMASVDRVAVLFAMESVQAADLDATLEFGDGSVEFTRVSFAYATGEVVFSNLSFRVAHGKSLAIVGQSGVGKSTILKLILGLYSPSGGRISVGGVDIAEINAAQRSVISYVGQDVYLFAGSVLENIRYGRASATDAEVIEVCRQVGADRFIEQLPDGYRTDIGEAGSRLSGGQKQRIGICRALLRNAKVILLDEYTSALDRDSEAQVEQAVRDAGRNCTLIVVTHKTGSLAQYDQVLHLDEYKGAGNLHTAAAK